MDQQPPEQRQAGSPSSGGLPQNSWKTLFKIAGRTWPVAAIWIAAFFVQTALIRNSGLKDVPRISQYFEMALLIEAVILFSVFKRLMPKDK